MKTLTLILILFVAGCWQNAYDHKIYDPTTGKLIERITLSNAKAMVATETGTISIFLPDGATLLVEKSLVFYDPNSWVKIGEGVGIGAKAFIIH